MKKSLFLISTLAVILFVTVGSLTSKAGTQNNLYAPEHLPYKLSETLPEGAFEVEEIEPLNDGTPVGLYDEKGNVLWQGTSQEYKVLIQEDPFFVANFFKAYEMGPKKLQEKLVEINKKLDVNIPSHARLKQDHVLESRLAEIEE